VIVKITFRLPEVPAGGIPLCFEKGAEMTAIDPNSIVDLVLQLRWKSKLAGHTDCYQASRVNIWRDILPPNLLRELLNKQSGERIELRFPAGDVIAPFDESKLMSINRVQFKPDLPEVKVAEPAIGRFYPKGALQGIAGIFKANLEPFRCIALNNGRMTVDFNHPLADKDLVLSAIVGKVEAKTVEMGGSSIDWMETLTAGPGMQARWQKYQTDYFSGNPFSRHDDRPDTLFYTKPRFTQHIDDTAVEVVRGTYGRFLADGARVLDLMSSWQSHMPKDINFQKVVGLGLNQKELIKNPQLDDYVIHDLNANPILPFDSGTFDSVVCTVSVEYITDPLTIFQEVARILRRDGYFILMFSNRWFPPKVVRIWREIHEFERMGLVLEYFIRSRRFKELQTYSVRGLTRPRDDKYFPELRFSDPVFAVWGRAI
jgi:SAM-dependent methyltransferase/FKBP-type peptidyl-prolyl cis-trans isomerase 2